MTTTCERLAVVGRGFVGTRPGITSRAASAVYPRVTAPPESGVAS